MKEPAPIALTLGSLFVKHKRRMFLSYGLVNLENLLRLAQPFVLGLAINGLLKSSYVALLMFVVQHLAHMLISSFRRIYAPRTFAGIYSELATRLINEQRKRQVDGSWVGARSVLSRQYVEFFERHVPAVIRALYSVVGALAMLAVYDWMLIPYCAGLMIPALLLHAAFDPKTLNLSGRLHEPLERELDAIDRNRTDELSEQYEQLVRHRISLSNADAVNFSLMELFVLAAMVASLVHFCANSSPQPGDIFAVLGYVLMFIRGLNAVPKLIEPISRLRDVGLRMHCRSTVPERFSGGL